MENPRRTCNHSRLLGVEFIWAAFLTFAITVAGQIKAQIELRKEKGRYHGITRILPPLHIARSLTVPGDNIFYNIFISFEFFRIIQKIIVIFVYQNITTMGGYGSGGSRKGAGRKPIDGVARTKFSVNLPTWLFGNDMRRSRPPENTNLPTDNGIINERA